MIVSSVRFGYIYIQIKHNGSGVCGYKIRNTDYTVWFVAGRGTFPTYMYGFAATESALCVPVAVQSGDKRNKEMTSCSALV